MQCLYNFFDVIEEVCAILCSKVHLMCGAVMAFIFYVTGGEDKFTAILVMIMILDYISGIIKSYITSKLNSKIGFRGILKKVMMILVICTCHLADEMLAIPTIPIGFKNVIVCIFICNEILSILENAAIAGIPIPKCFKTVVAQRFEQVIDFQLNSLKKRPRKTPNKAVDEG